MTVAARPAPGRPCPVGTTIARWTEQPTNLDVFLIGTAYWTTHRIHYDRQWARAEGYDDVVVPGVLMYGWVERALVAWAVDLSAIRSLRFRHTGLTCVGEQLTVSLVVAAVRRTEAATETDVAIAIDKSEGGSSVLTGTATVVIPSRDGP